MELSFAPIISEQRETCNVLSPVHRQLLQLRVLCLGLFQDGDVGVGVFPEGKELLVAGPGFSGVARTDAGAAQLQSRHRTHGIADRQTLVIKDFLKFSSSFGTLIHRQICQTAHLNRIQSSEVGVEIERSESERSGGRDSPLRCEAGKPTIRSSLDKLAKHRLGSYTHDQRER